MNNKLVREKRHRLPKEYYQGEISVAFTLCFERRLKPAATSGIQNKNVASDFSLSEHEIMNTFTDILTLVIKKTGCIVPVYCFMPDHQHLILTGTHSNSDIWKTIVVSAMIKI